MMTTYADALSQRFTDGFCNVLARRPDLRAESDANSHRYYLACRELGTDVTDSEPVLYKGFWPVWGEVSL